MLKCDDKNSDSEDKTSEEKSTPDSDSLPDENIEAPKSEWIREGIEENDNDKDTLND